MTMSRSLGFMEAGGDVDGVLKQLSKETDYRALVSPIHHPSSIHSACLVCVASATVAH